MTKLSDVVEIRSGYTFRGSIAVLEEGSVMVVQAKNIHNFTHTNLSKIRFTNTAHYLQTGDVLLSARGFIRAHALKNVRNAMVASSSVFVLRPIDKDFNSQYLAMYFNSAKGASALLSITTGAAVKTLLKSQLEQLEIPDVPPDRQRRTAKVIDSIDEYLELLQKKQTVLDHLKSAIITQSIKETRS